MAQYKHHPEVMYDYVEELDANLVCAICQSALVDPVTTTSCKHTFCRDCIERAISVNPQCPIDRSALTTHSLRETEQLVRLMLDELKVRCGADDCGVVMERGSLLAHLRSCPMAVTMCQDGECGLQMPKQRVSEHRAYECFQRKMECDKCGVLLTFKDQTPRHLKQCSAEDNSTAILNICDLCDERYDTSKTLHRWVCPSARVPCTHTDRGCPAIITRSSLSDHLKACPFEAMASFFTANDARLERLEKQQYVLLREVASLRTQLQAERALAGTSAWRNHDARRNDGFPARMGEGNSFDHHHDFDDLLAAMRDVPPGVAALATPDPIPPYSSPSAVPLPPSITPRAAADIAASRSLFAPSFGSRQSYADWAFHQLVERDPQTPSTTQTVQKLTRVAVQLASGLDMMERRNEVRTMTESLRVLEEVGALRAIVNTVRMQVMNDRPGTPSLRRSFGATPAPSTTDARPIPLTTNTPAPAPPRTSNASAEQDNSDEQSVQGSVSFSGQGFNTPASGTSRAHVWALQDISRRRAGRNANTIGGVGGIVGEPIGMPATPPERSDPMVEVQAQNPGGRLGRAMSSGLSSIRSVRRNQAAGPRL